MGHLLAGVSRGGPAGVATGRSVTRTSRHTAPTTDQRVLLQGPHAMRPLLLYLSAAVSSRGESQAVGTGQLRSFMS